MPGAGGCVGGGCRGGIYPSREVSGGGRLRGVEDAAPYDNGIVYGFPQTGNAARLRRGEGTPPYGWGYGNAMGLTWAPVSGPPRGRGRACPARRLRGRRFAVGL